MAHERDREERQTGMPVSLACLSAAEFAPGGATGGPRLTIQGKLVLGLLVAALPVIGIAVWLAWGTGALWVVWLVGVLSLTLGVVIVAWGSRPISELIRRARAMAGVPQTQSVMLGMVRTGPPGNQLISDALDKIEQSLQEIQALNRIGQLVASDDNLEHILTAIIEEAELVQADAGIIGSWDPERWSFATWRPATCRSCSGEENLAPTRVFRVRSPARGRSSFWTIT
jgi:hypothetical protein